MNPNKKVSEKKLEKRERGISDFDVITFIEFNVYISGANVERVNTQLKREKQSSSQTRSQSRESRKLWSNAKKPESSQV
jgi:hypothetical protein